MQKIEIRIKDRVGVVNEVTGIISHLGLHLQQHQARVIQDRSGTKISVFQAELNTGEAELFQLRQRISRIRGFLQFTVK